MHLQHGVWVDGKRTGALSIVFWSLHTTVVTFIHCVTARHGRRVRPRHFMADCSLKKSAASPCHDGFLAPRFQPVPNLHNTRWHACSTSAQTHTCTLTHAAGQQPRSPAVRPGGVRGAARPKLSGEGAGMGAHCTLHTHTHTTLMWHALTSKHGLLHSHARRRANRAQARRIPERQAHHQAQWQARQRACIQARQQVHQLACQQAHQRLHQRAQGFSPWTPHWPRWTCCRRGCR